MQTIKKELIPGIKDKEGKPIHRGDRAIVWEARGALNFYNVVKQCGGGSLHLSKDPKLIDTRRGSSRYVQPGNIEYMVYIIPES